MNEQREDDWNALQHEIEFDKNSSRLPIGASDILQKLADWSIKYNCTLEIISHWEDGEQPNISSQRGLEVLTCLQRDKSHVVSNVMMVHGSRKVLVRRL